MTPYYADSWLTIYSGDSRAVLATLPADSVDCVVTSPPYWGLRDYGTATWLGGDAGCDHIQPQKGSARNAGRDRAASGGTFHDSPTPRVIVEQYKGICGKCGATRQDNQLGLERTPEEYVANMVAVFAEVRRVLKPSGTCWLNLGDSYTRAQTGNVPQTKWNAVEFPEHSKAGSSDGAAGRAQRPGTRAGGLKDKDLVGIPWRVAFALQADGWYLRSDIIWAKPNPMPESVTDRPTKAHEYLFLLTKSARYYFDADAVREEQVKGAAGSTFTTGKTGVNGLGRVSLAERTDNPAGRNIRSVWTIATRPYPGAHFAVFPPELPERCIKAGSSEKGVCPECGAPWDRQTVKTTTFEGGSGKAGRSAEDVNANGKWAGKQYGTNIKLGPVVSVETTGWKPTCTHYDGPDGGYMMYPEPSVVLDPFAGSGTTGMVAQKLGRRAILIDLNPDYLKQQLARNAQTPLGLDAA